MYKPTTLKDIADELGFSISTVSRALSDWYEISDKTKEKVTSMATAMNYNPNPVALSLKKRRNYSLGVMISSVDNTFFSQVIDGIESVAYSKGYHVVITQSHESFNREVENVQHLINSRVDGMLISLAAESTDFKHIESFHNNGGAVVFFDRVLKNMDTHKIVSDNYKGAFEGTEFLIKEGCQKIAFLGSVEHLSIIEQRLFGYQEALIKHGKKVDHNYIKYCGFDNHALDTESAMMDLLNTQNPPDAIFTGGENESFGCLQILNKLGLNDKILVAGFSNTDMAKLLSPPLHCVKQNAFEMGKIATEKLIELIESTSEEDNYETVTLQTEFESYVN